MTTVLGKWKSRTEPSVSEEEAQVIFRRAFEAKFMPLDEVPRPAAKTELQRDEKDDDESDDDSGWSGFSDDDSLLSSSSSSAPVVDIIEHTSTPATITLTKMNRDLKKTYLSSRPPPSSLSTNSAIPPTKSNKNQDDENEDSATLLKNDIALQRLLAESHLFKNTLSSAGPESTVHVGKNRHRATDLRLAALGSKESIYKQVKMPRAIRQGIHDATAAREAKRRREAKENGIILERPSVGTSKAKKSSSRRERAVDAPTVGKFNRGMLKLSNKDIRDIQGPEDRRRRKDKKRRR